MKTKIIIGIVAVVLTLGLVTKNYADTYECHCKDTVDATFDGEMEVCEGSSTYSISSEVDADLPDGEI